MSLRPKRTEVDHNTTGDAVAVRVLAAELVKLNVEDAQARAGEILRALKAGPPQLVIIQQGKLEELTDTLEELRRTKDALESDMSDLESKNRALIGLVDKALAAMRRLAGKDADASAHT